MAYYDLPTANDTSGFYEMFRFVSVDATGGVFFPSMLLVIWVISFLAIKQYSNPKAFTFASFFCTMLGIMMATLNLIEPRWMYLSVVMTMIGFVWLKLDTT